MMTISYVLDSIDARTVVLPEFQRGYVWSREQVKGLIRSLYRRYPVGGLLIWNAEASSTELRGGSSAVGSVKILLDGQQRITSLYGVIRGSAPPFFEDPTRVSTFTGLHFHLGREDFEFHKPTIMDADPMWISVTELMQQGPAMITKELGGLGLDPEDLVLYINRAQTLYGIRDVQLHDENLSGPDKTLDVVVDIFDRVNSGGTKLSKGDLALARIAAIRPEARPEMRAEIERWKTQGFDLSLDWLLRCVNVVTTGRGRFEAMGAVTADEFAEGLVHATKAVDFVLNLLVTRLGLDHDRVLMGRYGIPAMVRIVHDHAGSISDTATQDRLLFWYICQGAWGRYSGSTETVLDRDLAALRAGGVDALIAELELWRGSLSMRAVDFDTQSIGSRFYPVLYILSRVGGARDFVTGLPLKAHLMGKGSKLEVHHIFPKAKLYAAGRSQREVNAVANFAFLTSASNKAVSDTLPVDYFPRQEADHPGVLTSLWISQDPALWEVDRYRDFLADRRQRLADATNGLLASLRGGDGSVEAGDALGGVEEDVDPTVAWLTDLCVEHGLTPPITGDVVDDEMGEILFPADAAWPNGLQQGLSGPVAFLLERDEAVESRMGELGYRFFSTRRAFIHHVEELLDVDIDGDGVVGPVDQLADDETLDDDIAESTEAPPGAGTLTRRSAVPMLVADRAIADGTPLTLRPATDVGPEQREAVRRWVDEDPRRGRVTWQNDRARPLVWEADGQAYRPSGIVRQILAAATGESRAGRATMWWVLPDGRTLVEAAYGLAAGEAAGGMDWSPLHDLIDTRVPAGRWTTYGDLARALSSGPQAVARHLATCAECPGGWRVLGSDGRPRDGFRWMNPTDTRSQQEALVSEGVRFIDGAADSTQRVFHADLIEP